MIRRWRVKPLVSFPIRAWSFSAPDVIDKQQNTKRNIDKTFTISSSYCHANCIPPKVIPRHSPLSSIRLWFKSMVFSAGLLFEITDTASLWMKSDFRPSPSRCSSSNHMLRFITCRILSRVSFESRVCDTFRPRKNVLYSSAETIAMRSLWKKPEFNILIRYLRDIAITWARGDRNPADSALGYRVKGKSCRRPRPLLPDREHCGSHTCIGIES